jgi:hypothetical protein
MLFYIRLAFDHKDLRPNHHLEVCHCDDIAYLITFQQDYTNNKPNKRGKGICLPIFPK